jgi:sugar lactone lactonase YvrE
VLLTFLFLGVGLLLSVPPDGKAQAPAAGQQGLRIREAGWNLEQFVREVERPGYLPSMAFDSAGNLYVANVGELTIPNDGKVQKVDARTKKVSDFSDATDVAAIAFDNKGRMAYSTGVANQASEVLRVNRADGTGLATKLVRGEFLLRMMPGGVQQGLPTGVGGAPSGFPEIVWSLVYGKPDDKGDQPLYVGTSAVGLGGGNTAEIEGRIFRVSADGKEVRGIATPLDVADIVVAPDGSLLFSDHYSNVISRVIPDGRGVITHYATLTGVPTNTLFPMIKKMAIDPEGNLYVMVREAEKKMNVFKVAAPLAPKAPPRVTVFAPNVPSVMLPVIASDARGNLYLVDNADKGLDVYRLSRAR